MAHKTYAIFSLFLMFFCFSNSKAQLVPAVYVFGDSIVDVGTNNHLHISIAKADFPHNGIDFPTKKATGRFSNGKNPADFIAEKLGLPTSPPYLSLISKGKKLNLGDTSFAGVSFASGGAGILNGNDIRYKQSIPLTMQVDQYIKVYEELVTKLGSAAAHTHLSKSIFTIVIGSNDIFGYNSKSDDYKNTSPQQYVDQMVAIFKGQLKRIYDFGGRKFVLTGLGPVGCCPSERKDNKTGGCNEEQNALALKYNEGYISMLLNMKAEFNDLNYAFFDTYTVLLDFIRNPALYGFTEVKAACCGLGHLNAEFPCLPIAQYCSNRVNHVFWDLYHPTERTSKMFVDQIYDGPLTFPINLRQLALL